MNKFKETILHIGIDKTGSTAIQNILFSNKEILYNQQKFLVPSSVPKNLSTFVVATHEEVGAINELRPVKKELPNQVAHKLKQISNNLKEELVSKMTDKLILSGEMISLMTEAGIKNFKAMLDNYSEKFRIVLVVRDPITWTSSKIQQMVKSGFTLKSQYDKLPKQNLQIRVNRWQNVFKDSQITILKFETENLKQGDIVQRFCESIGIDHNFYMPNAFSKSNSRLSHAAIDKMSNFNQTNPLNRGVPAQLLMKKRMVFQDIKGPKYQMPDKLISRVKKMALADMKWLEEHHRIKYFLTQRT